ncbi:MAG: 4Fe-4S binding protein [Anaerolineae bacterium]|nr:4Fe-4S binding protein [Anaerolineae bacterium]
MALHQEDEYPVPIIISDHCAGCGLCVQICPTHALAIREGVAVVVNPQACTYAGHCERICPTQAISRYFEIVLTSIKENSMKPVFYPNWQEKVIFSPEGPQPQLLAESEKLKVIIGSLDVGQKIPPHPEALAVYHFLEGTGWMTVDDERHPVRAGATVITPEGAKRGVEAETRLVFLATRIA